MGGTAAMLFSRALRADVVIMGSPQYTLDPARAPYDARWAKLAATIQFRGTDVAAGAAPDAQKYLIYDPQSADRHHAALFAALPGVHLIPVVNSGHYALGVLGEAGLFHALIPQLARGAHGPAEVLELARALHRGRRCSRQFWDHLAERSMGRRPALAARLLERRAALWPADRETARTLHSLFSRTEDRVMARLWAERERNAPPEIGAVALARTRLAARLDCAGA